MTRSLEDPTFAGHVESVVNDLSYHIEFAGETSPTYRVRVFENPELMRTDAKLEYPAYTSMEHKTAEDIRHVTAVEGTKLTLLFRLNKEVASAKLVDEKGQEVALAPPAAASAPVYTTAFTLADSHRYKLQLVDREGRKNKLSADLGVNVTRNRPPAIALSQPGHDVRVSPVEELRIKAQVNDDFGVVRHGINLTMAGTEPRDVVLSDAARPRPKRVQLEHLIDFEALKAVPDQLVTYFVWAEDFGPDGKTRRTEGDMYFAEVRHFEEIFRQGEQPSASAENEQDEQGGGNARQAEQLAELQKDVINGTWKVIRRENGARPTDKFVPDTKVLRESQESVITRAETMKERLQDAASKASLERALKAMKDAVGLLGEAADQTKVALAAPCARGRAGRVPGLAQAQGPGVRGHPQSFPPAQWAWLGRCGHAAATQPARSHQPGGSVRGTEPGAEATFTEGAGAARDQASSQPPQGTGPAPGRPERAPEGAAVGARGREGRAGQAGNRATAQAPP